MKFCPICKNMLYMRLGENGVTLELYCKHCSFVEHIKTQQNESSASTSNVIISSSLTGTSGQSDYKGYMTKDLKHDPTLPRVRHIKCANPNCTSTDASRQVIYLKYDNINLNYLYFCITCEQFWTTDRMPQTDE